MKTINNMILSSVAVILMVLSSVAVISFSEDDAAPWDIGPKYGYGSESGIEVAYYEDEGEPIVWINLTNPPASSLKLIVDGKESVTQFEYSPGLFIDIKDIAGSLLNNGDHIVGVKSTATSYRVQCTITVGTTADNAEITGTSSIKPGATTQLEYKSVPSKSIWKGLKDVKWSSDDTSIADVDSNGKVTGKSVGETTIRLSYCVDYGFEESEAMEATFKITVSGEPVPPSPEPTSDNTLLIVVGVIIVMLLITVCVYFLTRNR